MQHADDGRCRRSDAQGQEDALDSLDGYTNYELIYGDKIILLDNGYYNRPGTQYKDLGFTAADITRADLIIVGHAHADHISDTAQVAFQTGAPVIGAPITITKLLTNQPTVNPQQFITVTGTTGQVLNFPDIGITVQPILGRHGEPPSTPAPSAPRTKPPRLRRRLRKRQRSRRFPPGDRRIQHHRARRDRLRHHLSERIQSRLSRFGRHT